MAGPPRKKSRFRPGAAKCSAARVVTLERGVRKFIKRPPWSGKDRCERGSGEEKNSKQ